MIAEIITIYLMSALQSEISDSAFVCLINYLKVFVDRDPAKIEELMVIRAQTQSIIGLIRTVMGATQAPDVRSFGVSQTAWGLEHDAAHLAGVFMSLFDPLCNFSAPS